VIDLKALNLQAMSALHYGELAQAEAIIAQLGDARPGHPQVVLLTGMLRAQQGRHDEAVLLLERLLKLRPQDTGILLYLGNALQGLKRFNEALQHYDTALAVKPDGPELLSCRGNALMALERYDEALASQNAALAAETRDETLWLNRGSLLLRMKRFGEALSDFEQALAIRPAFARAMSGKGNALLSLHQPAAALEFFEHALRIDPSDTGYLMNRAVALVHLDRFGEALTDYYRILAIDPAFPKLAGQIALAALYDCDWERIAAVGPEIPGQVEAGKPGYDPWTLMGYGMDGALLLKCARNVLNESFAANTPPLWTGQVYRHDRIRLAYVSSDFRSHPVGFQIAELLERHDRSRFEVIGISAGTDDGSDIRARLLRAFDRFHDLAGKSDADIAQTMRALEVDVAVDLSGHTHGQRLGAFALRPAPVQATWLGFPDTTGADFMDYIIADDVVTPPEHQPFYSEKIVTLPDSFFPLDTGKVKSASLSRAEAGLPEAGFVFCCFNRNWKITSAIFDIWLRLLQQIPDSVLWLRTYTEKSDRALRKRAEDRGLGTSRLIFAERAPLDVHLARHALADLFLDTLPYGAHATAADALWAGLPVLTQLGPIFPGRVGASLLNAAGLPELISHSAEEYEATALALARDPARLKALREKLAANRVTAPLFDMARFTRNLEGAFEKMLAEKT